MAFIDEKELAMAAIRLRECDSAHDIEQRLNSYDDILKILYEFAGGLECEIAYIDQLLSYLSDSELTSRGIYRNKTGTILNNPRFLLNCTYDIVNLNHGALDINTRVLIYGSSSINTVNVDNTTTILVLHIASGSEVALLDVKPGSVVTHLTVTSCPTLITNLEKVSAESIVQGFYLGPLSIFNGQVCEPIPDE